MSKINPHFLKLIEIQSQNTKNNENNKVFDAFISFKNEGDLEDFLKFHDSGEKNKDNLQKSIKIDNKKIEIFYKFTIIHTILIKCNYSILENLEKEPLIKQIDGNYRAYLSSESQKPLTNLHFIKKSLLKPTGNGVRIAIFDSGIDYEHPYLKNRVSSRFNLTEEEDKDLCGHGTMMAGIICGNHIGIGKKFRGIAPNAEIIDVKITDKSGKIKILDILMGMESVKNEKIDIFLLSAVSPFSNDDCDILSKACEFFIKKNVIIITPAGNFGPESGTIGSPGMNENVFCIGTHNDEREIAFFSSRGTNSIIKKPDLVLHGVNITTTKSSKSVLGGFSKGFDPLSEISGTSASAAIFSGLVALLKETRPNLTPKILRKACAKATIDLKENPISQGKGSIDSLALFQNLHVYIAQTIKPKKITNYSLVVSVLLFTIIFLISFFKISEIF